jgi:hypothetical protein
MTAAEEPPAEEPPAKQPGLPFPLQDGEAVIEVCRRHWVYLWPLAAFMLLVALAPPVVVGLLLNAAGGFEGIGATAFLIGAAVYLLYWVVRIFLSWYRYHNDIWVITNQRLIDSYKRHPFNLRVATADLVNVQDMTIERVGVLRTLLDFGDIVCQTAAEVQELRLVGIPDPRRVQALVDRERDRERMRIR